jgi:ribosomal protein S4
MINKTLYRYKPVYKKLASLKKNVQNRKKILKFRNQKWQFLVTKITKLSKLSKTNCYYKFYDQNTYYTPKFNNFFSKNYKQNLLTRKGFNLFYGSLTKKYLKNVVSRSFLKSNYTKNRINSKLFFKEFLESRLDIILHRSHFTLSVRNARQLISHGHVYVNNKCVKDASFLVKKGDLISFSPKTHKLIEYYLVNSDLWPLPPKYLQISYKIFQISIIDDIKLTNDSANFFMWLNLNSVMQAYKN